MLLIFSSEFKRNQRMFQNDRYSCTSDIVNLNSDVSQSFVFVFAGVPLASVKVIPFFCFFFKIFGAHTSFLWGH